MFEKDLRDFSIIQRWTDFQVHHRQSLGDHSHLVAIYADQIAAFFNWSGDRAALLRYTLWHNAAELCPGDLALPFPEREWEAPADPELLAIVKLADQLDGVFYLSQEVGDGNTAFKPVLAHAITRLADTIEALPFPETERKKFSGTLTKSVTELMHAGRITRILG